MKNMCTADSLLDDFCQMAGCMYLSDLKSPKEQEMLCVALKRLHPEDYSVDAWCKAAVYLAGPMTATDFTTQQEVRTYLIERCEKALSCEHRSENDI